MANTASPTSLTVDAVTTDTRTIAFAVPSPVTVHALVPLFGVVATIVIQVMPLLRDSSIFIAVVAEMLTDVQVMLCDVPICQDSPPFGEVTETDGGG
ncbi:MAG: hypothetical protein Q7T05_06775, partial [Dehalococcoidia bacterium]|nr:hypothetical protein [Dehalococcoidia bacterium]